MLLDFTFLIYILEYIHITFMYNVVLFIYWLLFFIQVIICY